jgi:hypothetical protein
MTLRFIDSFDHYNTAQIPRKWAGSLGTSADISISSVNPRNGVQHLRITDDDFYVEKSLGAESTWIVGFGFYYATTPPASGCYIHALVDSGIHQVSILLNTSGNLVVHRGGSNTGITGTPVSGGISSLSLAHGNWYFIEIKITISNSISADSCIVKVNGSEWINVDAGQDTQITANPTAGSLRFGWMGSLTGTPIDFDDIYICDVNGGINDDFLGDCRVECKFPNANGAVNQFVGSDANSVDNYLHVDETPQDDDVTYNQSDSLGNQDLYGFEDLSTTPDSIFGVQTNIVAKKDDAGAREAKTIVRSGGTTYDGDDHVLSQGSYQVSHEIHEVNPDTAVAWTESNFNSAEFGVEVV